jgi:hypothetical protein
VENASVGRPPGKRPHRAARAVAWGVVAVLTACSAAASPRTSPEPRTGSAIQTSPSGPAWLLTRSALSQLLADPAARDECCGGSAERSGLIRRSAASRPAAVPRRPPACEFLNKRDEIDARVNLRA